MAHVGAMRAPQPQEAEALIRCPIIDWDKRRIWIEGEWMDLDNYLHNACKFCLIP